MVVDLEDAKPGRFVDCGELIEAARGQLEVRDIDLHRLTGTADLGSAPGQADTTLLERDPGHLRLTE